MLMSAQQMGQLRPIRSSWRTHALQNVKSLMSTWHQCDARLKLTALCVTTYMYDYYGICSLDCRSLQHIPFNTAAVHPRTVLISLCLATHTRVVPVFSSPAFSTPVIWSSIFHSHVFSRSSFASCFWQARYDDKWEIMVLQIVCWNCWWHVPWLSDRLVIVCVKSGYQHIHILGQH